MRTKKPLKTIVHELLAAGMTECQVAKEVGDLTAGKTTVSQPTIHRIGSGAIENSRESLADALRSLHKRKCGRRSRSVQTESRT